MQIKNQSVHDYKPFDPFEYPGEKPGFSFLLEGSMIYQIFIQQNRALKASRIWVEETWKELDEYLRLKSLPRLSDRCPIIVYGSLRNPPKLYERFNSDVSMNEYIRRANIKETFGIDLIPVFQCFLKDYDVVYMAHASKHGYLPITLVHSSGTLLPSQVIFLEERQMKMMDISEGRDRDFYKLIRLKTNGVMLENGGILKEVYVYANTNRVLRVDEKLIRPKNVFVENPQFQSKTQQEILSYILKYNLIQEISDSKTPQELNKSLSDEQEVLPKINQFLHVHLSTIVEPIGDEIPFIKLP